MSREDLINAHILTVGEMAHRGWKGCGVDDSLLKESQKLREVSKKLLPQVLAEQLDKLPDKVLLVSNFVSVVGSAVYTPEGHDWDVLLRASKENGCFLIQSEGVELPVRKALTPNKDKELHYIANPQGPHADYVPLYDLALVRRTPEVVRLETGVIEPKIGRRIRRDRIDQAQQALDRAQEMLEMLEDFLAWARYTDMEEPDFHTSEMVQKPLPELGKSELLSVDPPRAGGVVSSANGAAWIPTLEGPGLLPGQYLIEPRAFLLWFTALKPDLTTQPSWVEKMAGELYKGAEDRMPEKTAILKSSDDIIEPGQEYYLCGKDFVYGTFICEEPVQLKRRKAQEYFKEHFVSDDEIGQWWPGIRTVYLYRFKEFKPFSEPARWKRPPGVQNRISPENITFGEPKGLDVRKLSDNDLLLAIEELGPPASSIVMEAVNGAGA